MGVQLSHPVSSQFTASRKSPRSHCCGVEGGSVPTITVSEDIALSAGEGQRYSKRAKEGERGDVLGGLLAFVPVLIPSGREKKKTAHAPVAVHLEPHLKQVLGPRTVGSWMRTKITTDLIFGF